MVERIQGRQPGRAKVGGHPRPAGTVETHVQTQGWPRQESTPWH